MSDISNIKGFQKSNEKRSNKTKKMKKKDGVSQDSIALLIRTEKDVWTLRKMLVF